MSQIQERLRNVLEPGWQELLRKELQADYFYSLQSFLNDELAGKAKVFPPEEMIFNAFNMTPFDKVKVVIVGQDPYHNEGQAHGLCFSVNDGIKIPPSLKNIFKELSTDLGCRIPVSGNLEKWASQGVLLLNTILTVRSGEPGSHQNRGWEQFSDKVIRLLSDTKSGLIFLLWGRHAQAKEKLINSSRHHILKSAHPSPLSAYQGFLGSKPFSRTNELLIQSGKTPVNWDLS